MDIIDIILAKKKATGAAAPLLHDAQTAVTTANEAVDAITNLMDDAQAANTAANEANANAEAAAAKAQAAAETYDNLLAVTDESALADFDQAFTDAVNAKSAEIDEHLDDLDASVAAINSSITEAVAAANEAKTAVNGAVTNIRVFDATDSTTKYRRIAVTTGDDAINDWNVEKNYTTTGQHEDGAMTQKAITDALANQKTEITNNFDTKIKNIQISGGGSGNVSGNISSDDEGSMVAVDENGNIIPSSITETDVILTQIIAGTYQNENIIGLEIDYTNKTFTRLQGAQGKKAGEDFDKFTMLGGRKRCIVNEDGSIERFLTADDTLETIANKRIMVYQPQVYYLRVPLSTTDTSRGTQINKEQIYIASKKYAGFELHPIFKDANDNTVKYVLLPAYESGTLRANGMFIKDDAQNVDLVNDKLVSIAETKPISGATQEFTYAAAKKMAQNNGTGWDITDLRFESLNQMLMAIEYGSLNLQNAFNRGVSTIPGASGGNIASLTGSTHDLLNKSGQAAATINTGGTTSVTYTEQGRCAISYRGLENPYGNMWRWIGNMSIQEGVITYDGKQLSFKLPETSGWINKFGYDKDYNWVFLPIDTSSTATNSLPVGDYCFIDSVTVVKAGLAGGLANSQENCGPFYYGFNTALDGYHFRSDSARVMFIPTANSAIEQNSYNAWINS